MTAVFRLRQSACATNCGLLAYFTVAHDGGCAQKVKCWQSRQWVSKWEKKGNKIRKHGAPRPKLYKLYISPSRENILWLEGGGCTERQSARLKFISAGDKALTGVYVNDGPMDSSPWRRRNSSLALTGSMWMEMTVRSRAVQRATAGMDNYWGLSFVWWGEHMEYFFTIKSFCTKKQQPKNKNHKELGLERLLHLHSRHTHVFTSIRQKFRRRYWVKV